jgi:phosphoribosyl-ATP pyrophosphohydrolase/phosphoribosyl-AMP cyclohydrolase
VTDFLYELQAIIQDRKSHPRVGSYTNQLFDDGLARMAQKIGEEGVEVVVAALAQGKAEQIGEISDLLYHTIVLMTALDLQLEDISAELKRRHK